VNLKQLETFYWAAKLGSFTAAAQRVNSTQSTVSMRIHELEQEFGVDLFDRSQRTARVTARGRELIRYAEQMLSLSAEMRDRISAPDSIPGVMRLGVAEAISVTWLPRGCSRCCGSRPCSSSLSDLANRNGRCGRIRRNRTLMGLSRLSFVCRV
jgi:DNA-binding transcriptional LysR family regulator